MDTSAYLKAVVEQTSTFADWVDGRDAATPVPTCPKWTLADLVDHVGATQRMVAMLVGERMTEPSGAFAGYVPAPTDSAEWRVWLTDAADEAQQAFESADDDTPVWDPSGAPQASRSGHVGCSARLACIARTRLRRSACGTSWPRSLPLPPSRTGWTP